MPRTGRVKVKLFSLKITLTFSPPLIRIATRSSLLFARLSVHDRWEITQTHTRCAAASHRTLRACRHLRAYDRAGVQPDFSEFARVLRTFRLGTVGRVAKLECNPAVMRWSPRSSVALLKKLRAFACALRSNITTGVSSSDIFGAE